MAYWEEDERDEDNESREVSTFELDEPGPCCICDKPGRTHGCYRCSRPVCYNENSYFESSTCGSWILDTWHPAHPHENEFYCSKCLSGESGVEA